MNKTKTVKGTILDGVALREKDVTIRYTNNEYGETLSFSTDDDTIIGVSLLDLRKFIK